MLYAQLSFLNLNLNYGDDDSYLLYKTSESEISDIQQKNDVKRHDPLNSVVENQFLTCTTSDTSETHGTRWLPLDLRRSRREFTSSTGRLLTLFWLAP